MKVRELYHALDERIPASLSCSWDNDGLMCCPAPEKEVRRVLVALDITEDIVKKAVDEEFDVILSHHPLIFKGLNAIDPANFVARKVIRLIRADVAAMSFHTRLDNLSGGVNDALASRLGLCHVRPFGRPDPVQMGRLGELLSPMSGRAFAKQVKAALGAEGVRLSDSGREVRLVAVLGGGPADLTDAIAAGADTLVTGDLKFNQLTDAPDIPINLIEAGHFETEAPVCDVLADMVKALDDTIEVVVEKSNRISLI